MDGESVNVRKRGQPVTRRKNLRYNEIMKAPAVDFSRLPQSILFRGLAQADLETIVESARSRRLSAEGYYFFQADPADEIFLLLQGRVRMMQINPDGAQVLLRLVGAYELFGGIALGQGETYPATAQAAEDSLALGWSKTDLMQFVARYPQMALNAMQMMADQVQQLQERVRQLSTERVERRLARCLLRLAAQTGRKIAEGVLIDLPLSRQDLAEMNGTTLYTVSRTLSQWEAQGLVILGREKVIVRFPHGLVRIAEDLPG